MILCNSREKVNKEREYLEMCSSNRVAGIILCSASVEVEEFSGSGIPLITIERYLENGTASVECDNRQGGRLAAQHLIDKGCKNILHISGVAETAMPADARANGFIEICEKFVIAVSGGSGVGKTTIASVITYYLNKNGVGAYTHSGDNYPRRVPEENDAERMSRYEKGGRDTLADKGYMNYDFFLPGLLIDAFDKKDGTYLVKWIQEIIDKKIKTVNMLGCHDGIPVLDLKGLLPEERIQQLIDTIVTRGGYVKDLHGQKNMYYQVNATYFSALGEDENRLLLARAIQLFMPGIPQIWYLDLFAGKNDYEAVKRAGEGGHKEINRTNLTVEQLETGLKQSVVLKQLEMIKLRNSSKAFMEDAAVTVSFEDKVMKITRAYGSDKAELVVDFEKLSYRIQ